MSIIVLLIAVLASVVVWWLSKQRLTAKPWLEEGAIGDFPGTGAIPLPPAKIGLGVFVAVVAALFALFLSAYLMRMQFTDWAPVPKLPVLWVNTGVLLLSSAALQWARNAADQGEMDHVRAGLLAGATATLAFIALQLLAWRQLMGVGYFVASGPAAAFFYLITAVHGLHLLGGVGALGRTISQLRQPVVSEQLRLSVELCAIYWHFLLLVWLVLLSLLLVT